MSVGARRTALELKASEAFKRGAGRLTTFWSIQTNDRLLTASLNTVISKIVIIDANEFGAASKLAWIRENPSWRNESCKYALTGTVGRLNSNEMRYMG